VHNDDNFAIENVKNIAHYNLAIFSSYISRLCA
jgi:hypothetical protein